MFFSTLCRRAFCLTVTTLVAACDSPPTPVIHPPSSQAVADISDAHQRYVRAIENGLRGADLRREVQGVLRSLEAAKGKPPIQPLFRSLYADLLAQDTTQSVRTLEDAQDDVLALCPQWIPAYIGKARLACREGDVNAAVRHIEAGEQMLHEIETFEPQEHINWFDPRGWFGLPFYDPTMPEEQRFQQMLAQLQGWFEWEDALREPPSSPLAAARAVAGSSSSRLRARLLLEKVRVRELKALTGPNEARLAARRRLVEAIENEVLPLDPEFLDAELLRAECLTDLGKFQIAESVLTGLANPARTRLSNDPRLLSILIDVYARWLVATREKSTGDPTAEQIEFVNVIDDSVAVLGARLGGLDGAGASVLVRIAEVGVIRSEWIDRQDHELHQTCDRILAATRNAIKAEGAYDLEPLATLLTDRLRAVERARRYPNGVPTRAGGVR